MGKVFILMARSAAKSYRNQLVSPDFLKNVHICTQYYIPHHCLGCISLDIELS